MSLINQVLNDLEKRGATLSGKSAVRPVFVLQERQNLLLPILGGLVALGAAAVAGWWWGAHGRGAAPAPAQPVQMASSAVLPPAQEILVPSSGAQAASAVEEHAAQASAVAADVHPASAVPVVRAAIPAPPPATPAAHSKPAKPAAGKPPAVAKPAPVAVAAPPAPSIRNDGGRQLKQVSAQQQADSEFHKANDLVRRGQTAEAVAGYESALRLSPAHDEARQALVAVLLDEKRNADAERVLQERLADNPDHVGFAMLLARLQVERNALQPALETLQKTLPYAGQQAEYQAFIAAVQQRLGQHKEAVAYYQAALQSSPDTGVWLMGMGISLQALQRNDEARAAFKRALESRTLSVQLQAFVQQRLKEL